MRRSTRKSPLENLQGVSSAAPTQWSSLSLPNPKPFCIRRSGWLTLKGQLIKILLSILAHGAGPRTHWAQQGWADLLARSSAEVIPDVDIRSCPIWCAQWVKWVESEARLSGFNSGGCHSSDCFLSSECFQKCFVSSKVWNSIHANCKHLISSYSAPGAMLDKDVQTLKSFPT
jgi:hypothetical protein